MSTTMTERPVEKTVATEPNADSDVIAVHRRTVDKILIGIGIVATAAFVVAGVLLSWGANFSDDYVGDELSSQNIVFPDEAALIEEGRDDLVKFAGEQVTTGDQAEAYASYIGGHLEATADGQTYADLGAVQRAARAAVTEAVDNGEPQATVDELQATVDEVTAQRETLFKGEMLRGALLSAFAWATVGTIAGYAAIGAFLAAAVMAVLVVLGVVHLRRTPTTT